MRYDFEIRDMIVDHISKRKITITKIIDDDIFFESNINWMSKNNLIAAINQNGYFHVKPRKNILKKILNIS